MCLPAGSTGTGSSQSDLNSEEERADEIYQAVFVKSLEMGATELEAARSALLARSVYLEK